MKMNLEQRIIKKFDEHTDIFPPTIDITDARVVKVLEFLGVPSHKKILDVGCGKGRFCRIMKDSGFADVVGIDASEGLIRVAQKNNTDITFFQANVTDMPFNDNEFDVVLCIEVLEHIVDIQKAIAEMARILKPGGSLCIIDKNIVSLHPSLGVPTLLWKFFLERTNKWFYPKNFPFREKYFTRQEIENIMKKHFSKTEATYISSDSRNIIITAICGIFPFLHFFIMGKGIK